MKKISLLFAWLFFLLISFNLNAQSKAGADYFSGKWSVLIKGIPNGDAKMFIVLEKKDGTMTGVVQDTLGAEISKISKAELTDSTLAIYFTAQGYDVNLLMQKKDNDHIVGNLLSMFDAEGERV